MTDTNTTDTNTTDTVMTDTVTTEAGIQQLKDILGPITQLFERLLVLLAAERKAVRARDPDLIEGLTRQVRGLLVEIQQADLIRQRLTLQLGKRLGIDDEKVNIEQLDQVLSGKSGLIEPRDRLRKIIKEVDISNRENRAIFKGVQAATEAMIQAMKEGTQGPSTSYDRQGYRKAGSRFNFLSKQL